MWTCIGLLREFVVLLFASTLSHIFISNITNHCTRIHTRARARTIHYHIYWSHTTYVRDDCDVGSPMCIVIRRYTMQHSFVWKWQSKYACTRKYFANAVVVVVVAAVAVAKYKNCTLALFGYVYYCIHYKSNWPTAKENICNVSSNTLR